MGWVENFLMWLEFFLEQKFDIFTIESYYLS